jgi:predicted Rossmann-fold nucleotide-binding protein
MADRSPRSVCVYCGSSMGADSRYVDAAAALGAALAAAGMPALRRHAVPTADAVLSPEEI